MENNTYVLLLNASYEPLRKIHWTRAVTLLFLNKADIIYYHKDHYIKTIHKKYKKPCIVKLKKYTKYRNVIRFSKKNIFLRDEMTCQYCNTKKPLEFLTLDHVTPKSKGGKKDWTNIVTSCKECNQRKGNKNLSEVGMTLLKPPKALKYFSKNFLQSNDPIEWRDYF